ncbi:MAG: phosphoribosylformylglycinamidine synthase subunit PurL, partial [Thermoleophilaceae bacterium]
LDDDHRAALERLLVDPLLQTATWSVTSPEHTVEISFLPGVTDTAAATVLAAARRLALPLTGAATGRRITVGSGASTGEPSRGGAEIGDAEIDRLVRRVIANPVIERWGPAPIDPPVLPEAERRITAGTVTVRGLGDDELATLGGERSLALDLDELRVVRDHFTAEGPDPTDVELETLAQTWSEHCSHKTFRAEITTDDGRQRPPLLDALRRCTDEIDAPFVRSAFVGNAGIVSFVPGTTVALKAETHNHPSAVEPFGGANTGVGGVIRDVLGAAHRPIAVTDVLCFGPPDTPASQVPDGALHPRRIRAGVVDGVADYGNKIGLPTVAGAVLYDPAYTTNPLVFAGCIGTAPAREPHTGPHPGDRVVVLGGRTGRDGIRGATFSSLTMDATTGEVAGASVQIGDPVTEKLLIDVLVGAEDLYSAITDCGAGGLSSAVGEMAEGVGAEVELDRVPLKYAGLAPWEIWLSEAQERMVVAVPPERMTELRERCDAAGVELADLGAFTGDGRLRVRSGGTVVLDLDTAFLHDGRPTRRMSATMPRPDRASVPGETADVTTARTIEAPGDVLLALLAHRNIASKAATIHRYDHEIRGATLVRPLVGVAGDGPADGIVLAEPHDQHGLAIGIGVNPWYGLHDPEAMAAAAVDEAIRNVVAVGADPDRVALLDNFSWGDPRRPSTLGELVAAVDGCISAARAHAAPFVSGKDSLNNEYSGSDGERHAVPPTLVITAVAHVPRVDRVVTPDLVAAGDVLVLLGSTRPELAGSHLDLVLGEPATPGTVPQPDPGTAARCRRLHRAIVAGLVRSCHDPSEGGLAVALAEMCIAGRLGAHVDPALVDPGELDPAVALFAESTGRFVVAVHPDHLDAFGGTLDEPVVVLGQVTDEPTLRIDGLLDLDLDSMVAAFHRTGPEVHP